MFCCVFIITYANEIGQHTFAPVLFLFVRFIHQRPITTMGLSKCWLILYCCEKKFVSIKKNKLELSLEIQFWDRFFENNSNSDYEKRPSCGSILSNMSQNWY
jgi:hypothetical protein